MLVIGSVLTIYSQPLKGDYKNGLQQLQPAVNSNFHVPAEGFYRETAHVEKGKNKPRPLDLVAQSGMLEILARFAYLETKYKW